jgi:hypothetical protein
MQTRLYNTIPQLISCCGTGLYSTVYSVGYGNKNNMASVRIYTAAKGTGHFLL